MAETQSRPRLVRFGGFEADVRTGELRKDGVKLKFGGQPFQLLAILLEHPGEVVTREELQKRLWPATFVDVERNLNTAVNKIREVLGDSAENPRYVETLPRRGYRFVAQIEAPEPEVIPGKQVPEPASKKLWWKLAMGMLAFGILAVGTDLVVRRLPPHPKERVLYAAPFTALPGSELSPSFSPDGSRIAFAWNSDPVHAQSGFDLYLKAIGSETLLRLTQHPSQWISAAWSPDGSHVAFHRIAGKDTGVYVVPALGGPERKLRSTTIPSGSVRFSMISWSPDGRWIAYSDLVPSEDRARIYLLSTETGETKRIPFVPQCLDEGEPAFSRNGESLAYWCFQGYGESGLYSLLLTGGEPRLISFMRGFPNGLTWSASGKELIYSASSGEKSEIWETTLSDGSVKRLAIANDANDAVRPTVSAQGDKLAYSSISSNVGVLRRDLYHPEAPALVISPSSRAQYNAQYSPDGKRIAFASMRSGEQGVWISDFDGGNIVQLSDPSDMSGSPQWSPDGTQIAFDSRRLDHWGIYLSNADERIPRKLVTNISDIYRPHWSRDGRWVYFTSSTVGKAGAYRCLASGGDAIALTKDVDAVNAQESFDGATVYFVSSRSSKELLMRLNAGAPPGSESEVDGLPGLYDIDDWALTSGGIYFIPAEGPRSLRYYDFATKHVRFLFEIERHIDEGLSVSADGRWILYSSRIGDYNSDIMLVDHFH
jgi:Tol biopolymer transport system component/DNA-binding winged helix-turn-helix (wHTH) protein